MSMQHLHQFILKFNKFAIHSRPRVLFLLTIINVINRLSTYFSKAIFKINSYFTQKRHGNNGLMALALNVHNGWKLKGSSIHSWFRYLVTC